MTRRLCIVPRWGGDQSMEWYPWLRSQPVVTGGFARNILTPEVADRDAPTAGAWVESLTTTCGREDLDDLYIVAHSVGCLGVLHYLASLPGTTTIAGFLAVAGWWTLDAPWETIAPWVYSDERPTFDVSRARRACPAIRVLISDNDPFTSDWATTRRQWQERVGARVEVLPGKAHFNAREAPAVLDALAALAGLA